jgi:hypothetical protein
MSSRELERASLVGWEPPVRHELRAFSAASEREHACELACERMWDRWYTAIR